jgi:hypothetical protein
MELILYGVGAFLLVVVPAFLYGFFKNAKTIGKDIHQHQKKKSKKREKKEQKKEKDVK